MLSLFVCGAVISITSSACALEKTLTGFYWPIGTENIDQADGKWLSKDPEYFDDLYHIGVDMMTRDLNHLVYSISEGEIIERHCSDESWGLENCALFIKHKTSDGDSFVALYGHLRTSLVKNNSVGAGQVLGTTGPWSGGIHLHFGIHPGSDMPYSNSSIGIGWGRMALNHWPDQNGFVDPINFIETRSPKTTLRIPYTGVSDGNVSVYWTPTDVSCANASGWVYNGVSTASPGSICWDAYNDLQSVNLKYSSGDWYDTFFGNDTEYASTQNCSAN